MKYIQKIINKFSKSLFSLVAIGLFFSFSAQAQISSDAAQQAHEEKLDQIVENSELLELQVVNGDTIPVMVLPDFYVTERKFKNSREKYFFNKMRKNVNKVYPYAMRATEIMREIEKETALIQKKRKEKKYLKHLEKDLKEQFEDKLKNLTRTQGRVLIKIIERETGKDMNSIIKQYKSGLSAFTWTQLGKFYGYDLKEGYNPESEDIRYLEDILVEIETYGWETFHNDIESKKK